MSKYNISDPSADSSNYGYIFRPELIPKGGKGQSNEVSSKDNVEDKFLDAVSEAVVEVLDISYRDREQFRRVLRSAIKDKVKNYLEQYQDYVVDYIGKELNDHCGINEKVEFDHALHAKLSNHFDTIKKLIKPQLGKMLATKLQMTKKKLA